MADANLCYPWWHAIYAPMMASAAVYIPSGLAVNADGNVPATPEALRAAAEKQLRQRGLDWPLTLDAYSLARNISSEVGSGSLEEQVALAETTRNQAKRRGRSVHDLIVNPQYVGHPNRGYYGNINKTVEGKVVAAGTGRFTSTSKDPTLMSIAVANLVLSGNSGDFARGADDQDGPDAWAKDGQAAINNFVRHRASNNQYWIGPLPGIDHWHTFLQITIPGIAPDSVAGKALIQRGIDALKLPMQRPTWPADLPICAAPTPDDIGPGKKMLIAAALVGGIGALVGGGIWLAKSIGHAPVTGGGKRPKTPKRLTGSDYNYRRPDGRRADASDDEWDVATDALIEANATTGRTRDRHLQRAAKIWLDLRKAHGYVSGTSNFNEEFQALPLDDQFRFHELVDDQGGENLPGLPPRNPFK